MQFLVQIQIILILNEIGIVGHGNSNYCNANESCDGIIGENTEHTKHFGTKITEKEKKILSIMNWIPKMHKNSTGARSIIASKTCFAKQISKSVSNVFKLVYFQIKNFHKMLNSYGIISSFGSKKHSGLIIQ